MRGLAYFAGGFESTFRAAAAAAAAAFVFVLRSRRLSTFMMPSEIQRLSKEMLKEVTEILVGLGMDRKQVKKEQFW